MNRCPSRESITRSGCSFLKNGTLNCVEYVPRDLQSQQRAAHAHAGEHLQQEFSARGQPLIVLAHHFAVVVDEPDRAERERRAHAPAARTDCAGPPRAAWESRSRPRSARRPSSACRPLPDGPSALLRGCTASPAIRAAARSPTARAAAQRTAPSGSPRAVRTVM